MMIFKKAIWCTHQGKLYAYTHDIPRRCPHSTAAPFATEILSLKLWYQPILKVIQRIHVFSGRLSSKLTFVDWIKCSTIFSRNITEIGGSKAVYIEKGVVTLNFHMEKLQVHSFRIYNYKAATVIYNFIWLCEHVYVNPSVENFN